MKKKVTNNIFDIAEQIKNGREENVESSASIVREQKTGGTKLTHAEQVLRDAMIDHLQKSGLVVVTDRKEGQRVLDEENERVRASRVGAGSTIYGMKQLPKALRMNESELTNEILQYHGDHIARLLDEVSDDSTIIYSSAHNGVWYMYTVDKDRNIVLHDAISTEKGRYEEYIQKLQDFYGIDGSAKDIYSHLRERGYRTGDNADLFEYFQSGGNRRNRRLGERVDDIKKQSGNISSGTAERMRESGLGENTKSEGKGKGKDGLRFFRTATGEAYGYTVNGKIYIDPAIANTETPIHEYAHLWVTALQQANPKEWQNVVQLMKGTSVWNEVKKLYPELKTDEAIADEVLAHYSGKRGAERLRAESRKIAEGKGSVMEAAEAITALQKVKQAIDKFWRGVADFLGIHFTTAEEVADRVMKDLLDGVDPTRIATSDAMREQENGEIADIIAKAKANGSYMKAPNGEPTNLTERQWAQVRTKAFKEWFGDWENDPENASKAVDENGEPRVFYHNTNNEFTAFDPQRNGSSNDAGWLGDGFYFYGLPYEGSMYGRNRMEVYLNIREPYYATSEENERLAEANDRDTSVEFRESVEDEGYDGVYYTETCGMRWSLSLPTKSRVPPTTWVRLMQTTMTYATSSWARRVRRPLTMRRR